MRLFLETIGAYKVYLSIPDLDRDFEKTCPQQTLAKMREISTRLFQAYLSQVPNNDQLKEISESEAETQQHVHISADFFVSAPNSTEVLQAKDLFHQLILVLNEALHSVAPTDRPSPEPSTTAPSPQAEPFAPPSATRPSIAEPPSVAAAPPLERQEERPSTEDVFFSARPSPVPDPDPTVATAPSSHSPLQPTQARDLSATPPVEPRVTLQVERALSSEPQELLSTALDLADNPPPLPTAPLEELKAWYHQIPIPIRLRICKNIHYGYDIDGSHPIETAVDSYLKKAQKTLQEEIEHLMTKMQRFPHPLEDLILDFFAYPKENFSSPGSHLQSHLENLRSLYDQQNSNFKRVFKSFLTRQNIAFMTEKKWHYEHYVCFIHFLEHCLDKFYLQQIKLKNK